MENFNNWEIDYEANYGGSDKKIGLKKNNDRYMLKIADAIPDAKRNNLKNRNEELANQALRIIAVAYLDLDILLLIWNKDTIFYYLVELKKIESINEDKQTFDVMSVPRKRPFVVSSEKAEEFKNSRNTPEESAFVRELAETFRKNNFSID